MTIGDEIQFLKHCFKHRKEKRFVKNVMEVSNDSTLVNMEEMGGNKENGFIYHIKMEPSYSGFFADHNRLLSLLYYADYYGMKPVVEYTEKYSYYEDHPVNGSRNPFEYYFVQPTELQVKDLAQYKGVLRSRKENAALAGKLNKIPAAGGYGMTEEYICALAKISKKYITLNTTVSSYMEREISELLKNRNVLGVHVRGTDFKKNYNGHPVCITPKEYLQASQGLMATGRYEGVFLATDDKKTVEQFQMAFGDKLVYYKDVVRSDGDETVMKSQSQRENHHYLLGLEVLRDMLTLAACDGLAAGLSQVSYSARIQKKSMGQEYRDLVVLNKGINQHRENCPV